MKSKKGLFGEIIYLLSTIISWTIFTLLIICAILLVYYFISIKIYAKKGPGYEPRFSLYTIISPSMVPNINVYDTVVDVKVKSPDDVKINDVITFNSDKEELHGRTITHRVISITRDAEGNYLYQTKGDANLTEDDGLVEFEKIVGKVSFKIPQLGRVQFFLLSKLGWILIVIIPALYIIIKDILKLLKIVRDPADGSSKFLAALNRPLIFTPRPKLLKYTEGKVKNSKKEEPKTKVEPKKSDLSTIMAYAEEDDDDDDEIDIDDLPSLK